MIPQLLSVISESCCAGRRCGGCEQSRLDQIRPTGKVMRLLASRVGEGPRKNARRTDSTASYDGPALTAGPWGSHDAHIVQAGVEPSYLFSIF